MKTKSGFTLLEVTLGMIVLTVAAVSMKLLMPVRESQAKQDSVESKRLVSALRMARQVAVARQTPVRFRFLGNTQRTTGFVVESLANGTYVPIVQESLAATVNTIAITFSPTGAADTSFHASFGTGTQTRVVDVIAGSGMVRRDDS